MKKMNKVIVAMMTMAITFVMPAMAGNKTMVSTNRQHNNGKKDKVVVVINNDKKVSHFDKVDKRTSHFDAHKHAYRPDVKTCTFKVSRHDSYKKVVAKAERIDGVMDAKWNARTREVTIRYDANKTSVKYIKHTVA